jgi:cytochrome bd ubiquinol oxidase subunit II
MDLQILWFVLIAILFTGFFVLEGFDYGIGILMPFLGKNDDERALITSSIGPFWDGNEVWMIASGGAMFAAFPFWYATMFSSFYLEMFLILFTLILRAAAFEFRHQRNGARWHKTWDWLIFVGSIVPGFLWGVIVANLIQGVPIDAQMNFVGNILTPFNPFAILVGVTVVALCTLHGAIFLSLRVTGDMVKKAQGAVLYLWPAMLLLAIALILSCFFGTSTLHAIVTNAKLIPLGVLMAIALLALPALVKAGRSGWAFGLTTIIIILAALAVGFGTFPNVMVSSLNPSWSLTAYNASSNPYSLTVMSWITLTLVPIIIAYQAWNYYIFRKRIAPHAIGGH